MDGRKYPWGEEAPDSKRAVFGRDLSSGSTEIVGERAKGVSPVGCYDMAGNVLEWCLDEWNDKHLTSMQESKASKEEIESWMAIIRGMTKDVSVLKKDVSMLTKIVSGMKKFVSPCRHNDTLDPLDRVVRGGSWSYGPWNLRCAFQSWSESEDWDRTLGFRVACAPLDAF